MLGHSGMGGHNGMMGGGMGMMGGGMGMQGMSMQGMPMAAAAAQSLIHGGQAGMGGAGVVGQAPAAAMLNGSGNGGVLDVQVRCQGGAAERAADRGAACLCLCRAAGVVPSAALTPLCPLPRHAGHGGHAVWHALRRQRHAQQHGLFRRRRPQLGTPPRLLSRAGAQPRARFY